MKKIVITTKKNESSVKNDGALFPEKVHDTVRSKTHYLTSVSHSGVRLYVKKGFRSFSED